ncbi:MAG: hypothetical protein NC209_06540 [Alistipes sp.]|nr:hypothetical protein [Alistipes senegalensis]MCM1250782.1 hypothetical protein [Alistipes sp.]
MYFIRSVKYFVALCVLCIALMALMLATGTSALSLDDTLYVMFHTTRYLTLFAAIVVLAALYPRFGFVARRIEGDIELHRPQILNAFKSAGFSLESEADGKLIFRAEGFPHRLMLLFEDRIEVSQYGQWLVVDGIRRGVAKVLYRLDSYIRMTERNE